MTEHWRAVPGFEGAYEVSDLGRVRSLDRDITQAGRKGTIYTKRVRGRMLRPGRMPGGHVSVSLGRGNSRCVHVLVLLAFIGPPSAAQEALHRNGVANENWLANLRWGTRSRDNKWHNGHKGYKLSPAEVASIKRALAAFGYRGLQRELADEYSVSECTISHIKLGRTHVDVES
jgi:hypothetical protein